MSKELEAKVAELHEARAELKVAKKALTRQRVEADGRVAQLQALHEKALAEAAEAASDAASTNEKRLTKV